MLVIVSVGIVYMIQFLIRNIYFIDIETIILSTMGPLLIFAMLFVIPEQLVILYCKYRFDSFNFNKKGNLKPIGSGRKDAVKY